MGLKPILITLTKVFSNFRYFLLAIGIASGFYLFNVIILNFKNFTSVYPVFGLFGTLKFFFISAMGLKSVIKFHSYVSLIIISFLIGFLFSLLVYKTSLGNSGSDKKTGLFGGIGIFLAALAPGCAACGIGLASVLGISAGVLSFLPYEGLELSIVSIIILGLTIIFVTKKMYICNILKKQ